MSEHFSGNMYDRKYKKYYKETQKWFCKIPPTSVL